MISQLTDFSGFILKQRSCRGSLTEFLCCLERRTYSTLVCVVLEGDQELIKILNLRAIDRTQYLKLHQKMDPLLIKHSFKNKSNLASHKYINFIQIKMPKISRQNFLTNKFSRSNTNKIIKILNNFVGSSTTANQLINLLTQEADEFCWYVGSKPAYHIQYQVDSVAIVRVNNFILIVWRPKYIEYPSMIQFPDLKDTKNQNLKLEVDKQLTNLTEGNLNALIEFIEFFFSTYFKKDEKFETNLVTFTKHFISKKTAVSYWHCIYDDDGKMQLRNQNNMNCIAKIHVSGIKKNYNKCLLIFSCKGERDNILSAISKKWMQLISFIAMVLIFVSVVTCSPEETEGVCQYRDEAMVGGAGLMMALFGLKIAQRKKNKPDLKAKTT